MEIVEIEISKLYPNDWNPNIMPKDVQEHLKREIKRIGMVRPLLIRIKQTFTLNKNKTNKIEIYEIIDGEHRYKALKELGYKTIPCIIIKAEDTQSKLTTINMNAIAGTNEPIKYAKLLKNLKTTINKKELLPMLNIPDIELESLSALDIMEGITETPQDTIKETYAFCPDCKKEIILKESLIIREVVSDDQ